MLKKIDKFMRTVLDRNLDLEERISRIVLMLVFIGSVIGMGRVFLGVTPVVLFALVPMCIVAGIALYMSVKLGQTKKASWGLILINNILRLMCQFDGKRNVFQIIIHKRDICRLDCKV